MNSNSVTSTVNMAVTSVAMFLIVLPEPATTLIGLAMLSAVQKNKPKRRDRRRVGYHGDVSYAEIAHNKFAFRDASSRKGFLSPAQFAMEPGVANQKLWSDSTKIRRHSPRKNVSYETLRGELAATSHNVQPVFYNPDNWETYRANIQPKKTITPQHGLPHHGGLPQARPDMTSYVYDADWRASRKPTQQNHVPGAQHGQMPTPWPNMPDSKYTTKIHRRTR